jgi:hypothetical protein
MGKSIGLTLDWDSVVTSATGGDPTPADGSAAVEVVECVGEKSWLGTGAIDEGLLVAECGGSRLGRWISGVSREI